MSKHLPIRLDEQLHEDFKLIKELDLTPSTYLKSVVKMSVDIMKEADLRGLELKDKLGLFLNISKTMLPSAAMAVHDNNYKQYYILLRDTIARKVKEQNENLIQFDDE